MRSKRDVRGGVSRIYSQKEKVRLSHKYSYERYGEKQKGCRLRTSICAHLRYASGLLINRLLYIFMFSFIVTMIGIMCTLFEKNVRYRYTGSKKKKKKKKQCYIDDKNTLTLIHSDRFVE